MNVVRSIAVLLGLLAAITAHATAQRTFVSVSGSDADPCSVAKPCRSFGAAIGQTAYGGEVIVLDSGGYGPVIVTQAVSIIAPSGVYAGISVPAAGVGVTVSTGAGDAVVLRGLTITPLLGGTIGINFTSGGKLVVEQCAIVGHFVDGIAIQPSTDANILVKDTHVSGANLGISISPTNVPIRLTLTDSVLSDVYGGVSGAGGTEVAIDNTRLVGRGRAGGGFGLYFLTTVFGGPAKVHVANSLVSEFGIGVWAKQDVVFPGAIPSVSIATSELTHNNTAVVADNQGQIALTGNRFVHNNQMVAAANFGVVTTSGTNYAADNGSAGDPVAGPSGLF